MSDVTAKITCTSVGPVVDGQAVLTFIPDYADGRNKEWSKYTPALSLSMTVLESVAALFAPGEAYTLTFTRENLDA